MRSCSGYNWILVLFALSTVWTGCAPSDGKQDKPGPPPLEAQVLGAAASGLLKSDSYADLTIEIGAVQGEAPPQSTLDYVTTFLSNHLNKPGGIRVSMGEAIPATGSSGLSQQDVLQLETQHRKIFPHDQTMAVYIMFLDNHSSDDKTDAKILGLAYRSTSMVIFKDTLRTEALPQDLGLVEKTVIAHEFGHILGLVNVAIPMVNGIDHYDTVDNPGHCTNPNCLMNYAVNTSRLITTFNGQVPPLDTDCLNDLKAAGGK